MPDQVRVFVSHHHRPEEDTFTAQLVARAQILGVVSIGSWVASIKI